MGPAEGMEKISGCQRGRWRWMDRWSGEHRHGVEYKPCMVTPVRLGDSRLQHFLLHSSPHLTAVRKY